MQAAPKQQLSRCPRRSNCFQTLDFQSTVKARSSLPRRSLPFSILLVDTLSGVASLRPRATGSLRPRSLRRLFLSLSASLRATGPSRPRLVALSVFLRPRPHGRFILII
jgi:hypothetical protein